MRVAIVGGTGPFGRALAARLADAGHEVVVGSRDVDRAGTVAGELGVDGASNAEAVGSADVVILATDADAAVATARDLRSAIRAPVLSVASRLEFAGGNARPFPEATSVAESVAKVLDVPVVAGLHSLPARELARSKPDADALVCGPDGEAKEASLVLAGDVVAGRAVDCGLLEVARGLEAMTAVLVNVNRRYKTHAGLRLTGLP